MVQIPYITLSNGYKMPMFGLGTYQSIKGEVEQAVKDAIDLGYRHIDTAYFYGNEKEIGKAIKAKIDDGTVQREDLFITTKLWNNFHEEKSVVPACKKSLTNLGLSYIDLYLIHWPFAFKEGEDTWPVNENGEIVFGDTDYLETWKGMEDCVRQNLTRSIGISNFNSEQIERLVAAAKIMPVNNQIEVSINVNQKNLIEVCKKHNISVVGYSPLGQPGSKDGVKFEHPEIQKCAKKYNKTPAQIALRYVYQMDAAPIPKSVTKHRIEENVNIFDFSLTSDELAALESASTGKRTSPFVIMKEAKYYPFNIPF